MFYNPYKPLLSNFGRGGCCLGPAGYFQHLHGGPNSFWPSTKYEKILFGSNAEMFNLPHSKMILKILLNWPEVYSIKRFKF